MGYADGYYYGQGRIICDTSTFSVGDTIRVRSMTDTSKVWNQQVATVGTALVFTVPCYDYYKICTVQTINDTPTEIGGVYKTVDYGQTIFLNVLDKTTLGGIQGILNAHQEGALLEIGDEVTITANGSDWVMQIGRIDTTNHKVFFVSKVLLSKGSTYIYYSESPARTAMQGFYNAIANKDKQYIKEAQRKYYRVTGGVTAYSDYVYIPGAQEVFGYDKGCEQTQYPLFTTQNARIRTYNGTASWWWLADATSGSNIYGCQPDGSANATIYSDTCGYLPCFEMWADS